MIDQLVESLIPLPATCVSFLSVAARSSPSLSPVVQVPTASLSAAPPPVSVTTLPTPVVHVASAQFPGAWPPVCRPLPAIEWNRQWWAPQLPSFSFSSFFSFVPMVFLLLQARHQSQVPPSYLSIQIHLNLLCRSNSLFHQAQSAAPNHGPQHPVSCRSVWSVIAEWL